MALVEVDAVDDPLDRLVERGVVEDHVRGLAAELEGQLHAASPRAGAGSPCRPRSSPVNAILSTARVDERRAGAAVAGDDVDDARRQLGLAEHVAEEERRERRRLGRLEDDGVPGGERRRDLPGQHQQREVPRDDLPGDAERLRAAVGEGVLELVRPAGVVEEVRCGERNVDVARLLDRLAAVHRLEHGELARALLEDARDPEQVLGALRAGERRPAVLERVARRSDGAVDLLGRRLRDLGQRLLGRRADRRVRLVGSSHWPPTKRP